MTGATFHLCATVEALEPKYVAVKWTIKSVTAEGLTGASYDLRARLHCKDMYKPDLSVGKIFDFCGNIRGPGIGQMIVEGWPQPHQRC